MEFCSICNRTATMVCECSALLCDEHLEDHQDDSNGHSVSILEPYLFAEIQTKALENLINQLNVLDKTSRQIMEASDKLIKTTLKLTYESLLKVNKKKSELNEQVKMTKKRNSIEDLKKLRTISEVVLLSQTSTLAPVEAQLQNYFTIPTFKENKILEELPILDGGMLITG